MKKIIKHEPGLVTSMHVMPRRNIKGEAHIFATQTKTLTKQRMEAILQQKENDDADGEAAPRSEDVLYGKLRKSGIKDLDTELLKWTDVIVEDLDKEKITQINKNALRRETLEMSIETEDDGKIPHRPYRRLSKRKPNAPRSLTNISTMALSNPAILHTGLLFYSHPRRMEN